MGYLSDFLLRREKGSENFYHHGPKFLTEVDWKNEHNICCVNSSLVQGVYVLELDRLEKRTGSKAQAPPWWRFFHFQLVQKLEDCDGSIFGAIYEYQPQVSGSSHSAPIYVIAFRGTLPKLCKDIKLDVEMIFNKLHKASRFEIGKKAVENTVELLQGTAGIWLAGHSLGAAMALLIGKDIMTEKNCPIKTYLFNPPFISIPIEWIKDPNIKYIIRFAKSGLDRLVVFLRNLCMQGLQYNDPLSSWFPFLYVNPEDFICSEYIRHFEEDRVNGRYPIRNLILQAMGKSSYPLMHLIPSAHLFINGGTSKKLKDAHGLHQWWSKDLRCESKVYR